MTSKEKLCQILSSNLWFVQILKIVQKQNLPNWCVGAGVIRNAVWDYLHEFEKPSFLSDVDVAYFNPDDLSREKDHEVQRNLKSEMPDVSWEVTNQAGVHLWFEDYFGHSVKPFKSVEEAVSTWPETATSIAVKLNNSSEIEVIAPLGLEDLFNLVVKRNPKRVNLETYQKRINDKKYSQRWPKVKVIQE